MTLEEYVLGYTKKNSEIYNLMVTACDVVFGIEMDKISFLYFLFYVKSATNFDTLLNVKNGA